MSKEIRTILIIDDSPDDLEFYDQLLKRANNKNYTYKVFLAEDATEGLSTYQENKIDCTFIDYNMPEADGLTVIEVLQAQDNGIQIPMVILTGEPDQKIQAAAARYGALDYIAKDVVNSSEQLEKVIEKVITWAAAINKEKRASDA